MKRRTYTSPEVKNRWNAAHYDRMEVNVPQGARDEIKAAATAHGQSVSAYIRSLIIRDNPEELTKCLRGGGVAESWEKRISAILPVTGDAQ